jgi:hypothetical protein
MQIPVSRKTPKYPSERERKSGRRAIVISFSPDERQEMPDIGQRDLPEEHQS